MPEIDFDELMFDLIASEIAGIIAEEFGVDFDSLPIRTNGRRERFYRAAEKSVMKIREISRSRRRSEIGKLVTEISAIDEALRPS